MRFAIIIITLLLSTTSFAEEIKYEFGGVILHLSFDEKVISRETLVKYLIVHPVAYDHKYHVPPSLSLCIVHDKSYYECGTRDLSADNFYKNAEVNIEKGQSYIETLKELNKYEELNRLVDYFKSSLEFGVWKNKKLLEYYQNWDSKALKHNYKDIELLSKIEDTLLALDNEKEINLKWKLSSYDWANRVNEVYRELEGEPPADGWNKFLTKYKISEKIVRDEIE